MASVPPLSGAQLEQYLARVRYAGPRPLAPTLDVLVALHRAQAFAIPYELLDFFVPVALGGQRVSPERILSPPVDLPTTFDHIVTRRRGGGCAPQNVLFAAVLKAVGFADVESFAAMALLEQHMATHGPDDPLPGEGHMVLTVTCQGRRYLCDLGSPVDGLFQPVQLALDTVQPVSATLAFALRLLPEDAAYTELRLLRKIDDTTKTVRCLAFRPIPRDADYVASVAFPPTETPVPLGESLLRDRVVVARQRPDGGDALVDRKLKRRYDNGTVTTTVISTSDELRAVLNDVFDLDLPGDMLHHLNVHLKLPHTTTSHL